MIPVRPLEKINVIFEGKVKVKSNEDVLPPQPAPVGRRLSEFVEGWKRITNDPSVLSIVTKGYRLRFKSPPLLRKTPWEIRSPQGPEKVLCMWEQISLMLQKNTITEVPPNSPGFYSNVFLVRKASGGWRPVIDLKSMHLVFVCSLQAQCRVPCEKDVSNQGNFNSSCRLNLGGIKEN